MRHFTDAEQALLAELVPTRIRLDAIDHQMVARWVNQLSDHECARLLTWVIRYGRVWPAPGGDAPT